VSSQESLLFKTSSANSYGFFVADLPTLNNGKAFWNEHVVQNPTDVALYPSIEYTQHCIH
jgi:hypothetical protein